jgi:hypothetical protein
MTRYSNPYRGSPADGARYVAAMLERLGGREPLDVLAEAPGALAMLVSAASPRVRVWRERETSWSIDQVVHHLADAEIVYAYRYRVIVGGERPEVPGYDQDAWALAGGYRDRDAGPALELFTLLRRANLEFLTRLDGGAWERTGRHERRGEETLRRVVELAAAHDLVHMDQIRRTRDAATARFD